MYPQHTTAMAPPQKPETFMLSSEAQQSLPHDAQVALQQVDNLKYFLLSAPVDWQPDQLIRRFLLPTGDYISCVLWNNLFHISGTDIVRTLAFRFQAFGRPVRNSKKFEEGIFSDLRNLKAGTDATLEEPKSPFLDFLYKNNCIRTQKKQKVFYWYSVPHDRLFLDALERDLKREKMGQDATTLAVSEPALSFEFDSSQSLYEQLTKTQQACSTSFAAAHASTAYGPPPVSPVIRTVDAMPPPQMAVPTMPLLPGDSSASNPAAAAAAAASAAAMYTQVPMSDPLLQNYVKREQDPGNFQYDRNGMALARLHQRHASMPTFAEYSPAPSFVSSQYEDYSNRGLSYEPITPPQHTVPIGPEPAYIANEDTGLYTAIPDVSSATTYNSSMMHLPPSNLSSAHFPAPPRPFPSNTYSVIEGSPSYKRRRRQSSVTPSAPPTVAATSSNAQSAVPQSHPLVASSAHRPSDLRHSVSSSAVPVTDDSGGGDLNQVPHSMTTTTNNNYPAVVLPQKDLLQEISRNETPLSNIDESSEQQNTLPLVNNVHDEFPILPNMINDNNNDNKSIGATFGNDLSAQLQQRPDRSATGPLRRARSATVMELGPYPQKSHSCPIPSCGRLFKRLEHLKRHVRTHTQERPYPCPYCNKAFSRSDNLAQHRRIHEAQQDGQQQISSNDEDFANEENGFSTPEDMSGSSVSKFIPNVANVSPMPSSMNMPSAMHSMIPPQMIAPQLLQQ